MKSVAPSINLRNDFTNLANLLDMFLKSLGTFYIYPIANKLGITVPPPPEELSAFLLAYKSYSGGA